MMYIEYQRTRGALGTLYEEFYIESNESWCTAEYALTYDIKSKTWYKDLPDVVY